MEEDIQILFGNNVKKIRQKRNLSQEKLAELSNLHRTYISALERGKRSISLKNIQRISMALNVKEFELFKFEEE